MTDAPRPHSARETVEAVKDILDTYPGAPCSCPKHKFLLDAKADLDGLLEQLEALVTLVRIGFLVTVNGEKGRTDVVNEPALRSLLFTILQAKDIAAAIEAVGSGGVAVPDSNVSSEPHGAFRLDVREATRAAAAGEFQFNRTCLALVSVDLVDEWSDWSEPVELKIVRNQDGLLDIEVRAASGV